MIFITTYKTRRFMSQEETKEMMEVFAEVGAAPGTIAHYTSVDGSYGVVISDNDDPAEVYNNILNYGRWIEFDTQVMVPVEEAVPLIMESLG